jgi:hypothetical protein
VRRALFIFVAALVVALAVVAAGCGGGGSKSSSGKPLTKAEFVSKADGICAKANKDVPSPPSDLRNGFDPNAKKGTDDQYKEFGDYLGKIVKIFRSEVDDLHGLKPPSNLQDTWDKALAALDEAINELDEAGKAAKDGDRDEVKSKLAESDKHGSEADKDAKDLGLTTCGSSA